MSPELFYESFFFLGRNEAEKRRLVCRAFDALCTGLRDVHGYKLQIDSMELWSRTSHWTPGPAEYIADVQADGRFHQIKGSEEELAAGLKTSLSVSFIHHVSIQTSALNESLCDESAALFGGVSAEIVHLVRQNESTFYETITSSKLQNFLLSFGGIRELRLVATVLEVDPTLHFILTDDFILRCRAKGMRTLRMPFGVELRLQETSEDELLQRFHAVTHG